MNQPGTIPSGPPQRLLSLDVLRGLTVALMIFVNNAGDGAVSYPQLRHSVWNGCTLTDIVFPLFLFIVGASIALSFSVRLKRGDARGALWTQILRRAAIIFALGLAINLLPSLDPHTLRVYGVLQRIALCYALAGLLFVYGRGAACIVALPLLLLAYWYLLLHVPIPGIGLPGRDIAALDRHGNLTAWLDRRIFSAAHLYRHGDYDPEGLLSTLPALATTLFGAVAAMWLQTMRPLRTKAAGLFISGLGCAAAGLIWAQSFPLNKRLWTSSYVLFTAGIAIALLAVIYWLVDGPIRLRRGLEPWLVFGTNALAAYILSELLAIALGAIRIRGGGSLQHWLYRLLPVVGPPPVISMLYSFLFVCICFAVVLQLYRRKIFIKL